MWPTVFLIAFAFSNQVFLAESLPQIAIEEPPKLCHVQPGNVLGQCVRLSQCTKAVHSLFTDGEKPTECSTSSEGEVSTICCPESDLSSSTQERHRIDEKSSKPRKINFLMPRSEPLAEESGKRPCEIECMKMYDRNFVESPTTTSPNPVQNDHLEEESEEKWQWSPSKTRKTRALLPHKNVVAGIEVMSREYPYMCALGWNTSDPSVSFTFHCGCVLIAPRFILTAAHCTSYAGAPPTIARIGGKYLNDSIGEEILIDRIIIHPDYRKHSLYNDIAIMEIKSKTSHKPACLWNHGDVSERGLTALGYGQTSFAGPTSDSLLKVYLKFMPNDKCYEYYSRETRLRSGLSDGHLCANDPLNKMDTCQGDSGGPLLTTYFNYYAFVPYIVGLTSFGIGCANGVPSVYTRISHYLDWIESNVWQ